MPELGSIPSSTLVKALNAANSGAGKTGALAGLARAGYILAIYDFDNGCQILLDEKILPKQYRKNVFVNLYQDAVAATPSGPKFKEPPTAWSRHLKDLDVHPDLGPVSKFTDKHVIVLDSLTFQGKAALRYILNLQGRLNGVPQIQDWGQAMDAQENVLAVLYSDAIPCNVIVNAHITFTEGEGAQNTVLENLIEVAKADKKAGKESDQGISDAIKNLAGSVTPERGYPSALGSKLPPRVGRYFNTMVSSKTIGSGGSERKVIITRSEPNFELKVPIPSRIPPTLPIDVAWVQIFKAIRDE